MIILLGISRSHFQNKPKIAVFLSVTPYAPHDMYRRVRGKCCLYHWIIRLSWRWSTPPLYCRHVCNRWYGITSRWTVICNILSLESQVWQVWTNYVTLYDPILFPSDSFSGRVKAFETTRLLRQKIFECMSKSVVKFFRICTCSKCVCMYVCMYVCMHACMHINVNVYVCMYLRVCMYVLMYMCVCVCVNVCRPMYVSLFVCKCVNLH